MRSVEAVAAYEAGVKDGRTEVEAQEKALRERLTNLERMVRPPSRDDSLHNKTYLWVADQLRAILEETK